MNWIDSSQIHPSRQLLNLEFWIKHHSPLWQSLSWTICSIARQVWFEDEYQRNTICIRIEPFCIFILNDYCITYRSVFQYAFINDNKIIIKDKKLNLPTIKYRLFTDDMIEVYRILSGKYNNDVANILKVNRIIQIDSKRKAIQSNYNSR